ncbi:[FeFe] hydrogenase H-cluster maturation GTPase HydF [Ruminococcus sp. HUN007]|uniref:[FeFe] hydrogenase H-cluster maturation GTPase HydF n=1 Tax=Ruminococcus sp. HUN007 TaxID=1514668 RepID=UPI0005D1E57C|nr:[FeFe] hydrogenase H-cluster maturation GTPase HydF [Ruminococcus sp. HUN007]
MGLNDVPSSERIHIAFFGKRNAGKSSLVNAVTGQNLSVVSDIKGTTTDPVFKAMELLPAGPVMIIDTPGYDDSGELGGMRVQKTLQILEKTDAAVLAADSRTGLTEEDIKITGLLSERNIPYITAFTKCDLMKERTGSVETCITGRTDTDSRDGDTGRSVSAKHTVYVSSVTGENITDLKKLIAEISTPQKKEGLIIGDRLSPADIAVLVIPVDEAAPKGRLILPQQMVMREILDAKAIPVATQPETYEETLSLLGKKPKLVITDSQAFAEINRKTPENITLTSFSILMANYKGVLEQALFGLRAIRDLRDGSRVLISEGCTHHRQCGDIGTVKLPALIRKFTGVSPDFRFTSGREFPEDLSEYSLVIHCGGCMLNEREMHSRAEKAGKQNIPFTNYGLVLSFLNGILPRTLTLFPELCSIPGSVPACVR